MSDFFMKFGNTGTKLLKLSKQQTLGDIFFLRIFGGSLRTYVFYLFTTFLTTLTPRLKLIFTR